MFSSPLLDCFIALLRFAAPRWHCLLRCVTRGCACTPPRRGIDGSGDSHGCPNEIPISSKRRVYRLSPRCSFFRGCRIALGPLPTASGDSQTDALFRRTQPQRGLRSEMVLSSVLLAPSPCASWTLVNGLRTFHVRRIQHAKCSRSTWISRPICFLIRLLALGVPPKVYAEPKRFNTGGCLCVWKVSSRDFIWVLLFIAVYIHLIAIRRAICALEMCLEY